MPSINMMLLVQYDSLGLEIVYLWILTSFLSFLMFSLKTMNMQIKLKGQCLSFKWVQIQSRVSNNGNMTDFVCTPPCSRITLTVAIETMHIRVYL